MAAVSESLAVGKRLGVDSKVLTQVSRVQVFGTEQMKCNARGGGLI
jgi:3-hydroxyisobutyrate dehydrogenase-like beta-hydroxyacid dehydrogenase